MKIFAGSANKPLASKIADSLGLPLSPLEIHIFPDGEKRVRVLENVVEEDTVVVQPTSIPVDANYMELFFIIDALKRSGAKSITIVIPYLGYQRQDHVFQSGEAVSLSVVARMLEVLGADRLIGFDLHTVRLPELFKIPVVHLSALPLFAAKIKKIASFDTFLVSPDLGGVRRVKIVSEMLGGMQYATIIKNRNLSTGSISAEDIQGKILPQAIIIDDMISAGWTIVKAVELLKKKGVKNILVFVTHAVFSQNAPQLLQDAAVDKLYVTDSILVPKEKHFDKLEILSIAEMISKALGSNN